MTMSPEMEPTESVPNQADAPPKSNGNLLAKDDDETRKRQDDIIDLIRPAVHRHPALYEGVKHQIRTATNLTGSWPKTSFYKKFWNWCNNNNAARGDPRPEPELFIATLAAFHYFKIHSNTRSVKFWLEVTLRGLEKWVDDQLEKPHPFSPILEPTEPKTPQQAPRVKVEPGISDPGQKRATLAQGKARVGDGKILKSIEYDPDSTPIGTKRLAPEHKDQPASKRVNNQVDGLLSAAGINRLTESHAWQRRIVLKDEGVQTDNDMYLDKMIPEPMRQAIEAMKESARKQDEQTRALQEQHQRLAALFDQLSLAQLPRQQYQPRREVVVRQISHQPPAYYYDMGPDTGNGGRIFGLN